MGVIVVVGVDEEKRGGCGFGEEDKNADMTGGASLVLDLGLKKGEAVGVTSLPKAPNPVAGLNEEGVLVRLPNAPVPPGLGPKGEADDVIGVLVSAKGEMLGEGEGEGEGEGRTSGLVGVGSSLTLGELGWGWGWGWELKSAKGDLEGSVEENAGVGVELCCCCCCPNTDGAPEENALNPPPLPEPNAPSLPLPPNPVAPPAANALNPPELPVLVLAGTPTAGFNPNPDCPNADCPNPGWPKEDCPKDDCPNGVGCSWSVTVFVFAVEVVGLEPGKLFKAPNPVAGFNSPPPPKVVVVVGAGGGENEPNIPCFCSLVLVAESLSPRLSESPPNEVSSPIEASLEISGGGEVVGEGLAPVLKPKLVCPNTVLGLALGLGKEPNAEEVPLNALLGVDVMALPEPNALGVEEALPKALGAEANALNPDVKGAGWVNEVVLVNAEGCPNVDGCPNPVVPKPLPLPKPNVGAGTGTGAGNGDAD